jgi:MFS family permease
MLGTLERARGALRSHDFRRLFAARLMSTAGDGFFQAALISSIVFSPEKQGTVSGFAVATLVVVLPYSILGPFAGVFIDRWSRRRILVIAPVLRAAVVALALLDPSSRPALYFAGALWVLSVDRFYLSTAGAVVPRLVPIEDLLVANSLATIGGTTMLLASVFVGGLVAGAFGNVPIIVAAGSTWLVASAVASRIASPLHAPPLEEGVEMPGLGRELVRVGREFVDGIRHIRHTPRALAPITSMGLDQMGQGLVLVLSLFVFRERFREGVGSFSWLIGAGGLGVFVGLLTVGKLEERLSKERIVALAFLVGGIVLILVATAIGRVSVLVASFAVGIAFSWKKVPSDTMVQEAVPDELRGRTFAVYDVVYQVARLAAAGLAVVLLPATGAAWAVGLVGIVFVLWTPVLPWWIGRTRPAQRRAG